MQDYHSFATDMQRQASAALAAREPGLAKGVLDETIAKAIEHHGFTPLTTLAARIGAGVIARFLEAGQLEDAEESWEAVQRLTGDADDAETRFHTGLCASNMCMGLIGSGHPVDAGEAFETLTMLAGKKPHRADLDLLVCEAGLRVVMVWLQLHPAQEAFDHYLPLKLAAARTPESIEATRCLAKAALLLAVAFAHADDRNFAHSLKAEAEAAIAQYPEDSELQDVADNLERAFSMPQ